MDELEKHIRYSELFSIYQNLLSKTQKEVLEDYLLYNLSFSEIAENRSISRAAVEDAIKKGKKKLDDFEEKVGCLETINVLHSIKKEMKEEKVIKKLDEAERKMKHGI